MCVIIVKPVGQTVSKETFDACWDSNPHGFGMSYVKDGKAVIDKGYMTKASAWAAFSKIVEELGDVVMVLHFRIRSAGDRSASNCHPFKVEGGTLSHNGTLYGFGGNKDSDTKEFCQTFGKYMTHKETTKHKAELGKNIGAGNKFAMLFDNGETVIVNEGEGQWFEGKWFSNGYWKNFSMTGYEDLEDVDWEGMYAYGSSYGGTRSTHSRNRALN